MIYGNSTTIKDTPVQEASQGERTFSYPNTAGQQAPETDSMLGGAKPDYKVDGQSQAITESVDEGDDRKPPMIEHAPEGAGDAPTSYDPHLAGFFDAKEMEASTLNQHELKEQLQTARKQLDGVLSEYQVGDSAARQMFSTVDGYIKSPRSPEAMDQERESTMASLEKKWGAETSSRIAIAQRVLNELDRKVPGLADSLVNTGAANNADLIIHLSNLGKQHGVKFSSDMGKSTLDALWSKKP